MKKAKPIPTTSQPMRILVMRYSSLGDVALTNPVLDRLDEAYPNAQIGTSLALLSRYADVYPFEDLVTHTFGVEQTEAAIHASRDKVCVKAMVVSEP